MLQTNFVSYMHSKKLCKTSHTNPFDLHKNRTDLYEENILDIFIEFFGKSSVTNPFGLYANRTDLYEENFNCVHEYK